MRAVLALIFCSCVSFTPAPSCDAGCPSWICECGEGTAPGSACTGGRCAEASGVCRSACADAGSCWAGRSTGGWPNGNSVGTTVCATMASCGDLDLADLGKPCAQPSECSSGLCVGSPASFICAKSCTSNAQCPAGWVCGPNGQGGTTCFIGAPEHAGMAVSTNGACKQAAFTDIGKVCQFGLECESRVCFGSAAAGFFCSRRCNDDSLCLSGFRCVTSVNDNARFCEKVP